MIANELGAGNRDYKTKSPIFNNVNNMLEATNPQKLWDKIAFYNFVQRPMSSLDSPDLPPQILTKLGLFSFN
ncbi:hypothetical protein EQP59_00920 [Ornithobacterium rhinotracheale]|uniref:Uncharacterized protein n=2 Tax=Ornithobacterium rhinotracheale TaxID=28251 RepID=A0A410JPI6_ORNRH|nr:hypothetical protein EQP59_00920 [Ornithobacterium rhinotracheale]